MHRLLFAVMLLLPVAPSILADIAEPQPRTFEFTYEIRGEGFPADQPVDIYLPLPAEHRAQQVLSSSVESPLVSDSKLEATYGNEYLHLHRPAGSDAPIDARLHWTVRREPAGASGPVPLSASERQRYLDANAQVPVAHEILDPILGEIHAQLPDNRPETRARAIYDWVVDNVEYKKVGSGWGNGDTFWACNERYGNCTDFHALFISLARTEGIPARFEIGFPLPEDREAGNIGGYHCWVQYYLPERGWVPIDASEASKFPAKRELFFGSQPANRIHFTTGRDLVISEGSARQPLNYFIYPYVEVGGKPSAQKVDTRFSYRQVGVAVATRRAGTLAPESGTSPAL